MGRTGIRGLPLGRAGVLCLVLGASGCLPTPPPLMYPSTPVPAGHFHFGGAIAGSLAMFGALGTHASPFPGLQLAARYGLGHGASLGLSISTGPDAMLDGRLEVLHTPRLSLSLGAELGVVGRGGGAFLLGQPPADMGSLTALGTLADVPVVLGVTLGTSTLWLGLRPGVLTDLPQGIPGGYPGTVPLAGGLVGLSLPMDHGGVLALQLDVTHDFGLGASHPQTVVTAAVGLSQ